LASASFSHCRSGAGAVFGGRKPVLRCAEKGGVSDLVLDCRQFIRNLVEGVNQTFHLGR
jgi:hypothetical protein